MSANVRNTRNLRFDRSRLDRLQGWMEGWVNSGKIPGAQTVVMRSGHVAWSGVAGKCDLEAARPWQHDTLARIYSMTKPVTSAAFLMLCEDALCHIDDPVDAYLPEFRDVRVLRPDATVIDQTVPCHERLTLHHLLTHTSGFTYGFNEGVLAAGMNASGIDHSADGTDLASTVRRLAELPLGFQPGSRWDYGVSTDVLGRVIEVISGQPLDRFFAERIFEPLGMNDTFFEVPRDKLERLASCYVRTEDDSMKLSDPADASSYAGVTMFSGGGGLVSSADDYLRFCEMLRGGGRLGDTRLLAPKAVELMTANALRGDLASMGQPVFSEVSFDGIGFGLGVAVMLNPALAKTLGSAGDFGWGGMASTVFWVDPREEMSVLFMTQLIPSSSYPLRKELRALVYSSLID